MRVGKWGILHHWALGKLNSMGSWCMELSDYMGGCGRRKLNFMGGWVKKVPLTLGSCVLGSAHHITEINISPNVNENLSTG